MQLRSDAIKRGLPAPHRSFPGPDGLTELTRPLVEAVVSAQNEVIRATSTSSRSPTPGKAGVRMAGGTRCRSTPSALCDGIAANHEGMKYSLTSREVIADSWSAPSRATCPTPWSSSPAATNRPRHAHRRVPPEHPHRAGLRRPRWPAAATEQTDLNSSLTP